MPGWNRRGFTRASCPRRRALPPVKRPMSRTGTSLPCRGRSVWRRYLVTKDGGAAGGFAEKVQAAADTGAQLVVLRRPPETGETETQILAYCKEILQWSH